MKNKSSMKLKFSVLAVAALALNLTGCSQADKSAADQPTGAGHHGNLIDQLFADPAITVVGDDLQPIPAARILIGTEMNKPFVGNYVATGADGTVAPPAGWTDAQTVTIDAPGYIRASYYSQNPGTQTYRLRKVGSGAQYQVKGITKGHNVVDKDGFVDFGLVMPALTRNAMLNFDMSSVISDQMDTIDLIMGNKADIPSNVTLPLQKESYIFTVTLEKPTYRLYLTEPGVQRIFAANGRFPFKEVVDKLRAKTPFNEVINSFTLLGGGVKDVNVTKSITQLDLSVTDLKFKSKFNVVAPKISGDEVILAIGMAPMSEYMVPTDVKRLTSGAKMQMSSLDDKALLMAILKKNQDMDSDAPGSDRLSVVLIPAAAGASPQFLPILGNPSLASNGDLLLPKMNPINGVNAVATYSVLSQIQEKTLGDKKVKVNNAYWEFYAPNWVEQMPLPKFPQDPPVAGKKHWEASLIGSQTASQVDLGPAMINNATHVTHSSMDF